MSASPAKMLSDILALPNDSTKKTIAVALALSLVCSLLVSVSAVMLRPLQTKNATLDRQRNILAAANLLHDDTNIAEAFSRIEARVVDLKSGDFRDDIDARSYDQRRAARDPMTSTALAREQDVAGLGRQARYAIVYLVKDGDAIEKIILPIHGYGLWSTLYGFIALAPDLNTVVGLKYFEHSETAGLGAEVDNPAWLSQWRGRRVFDESGVPVLHVAKGKSRASGAAAQFEVDGLAGATLTSTGVTNMLRFWLGEQGFGPFLEKMRTRMGKS
jgi:Na+-transporting NADH:ubiquinone oxidoreductase subunit C